MEAYQIALYCIIMMSVRDFAAKKGVPMSTVYKWIERQVEHKHGFRPKRFGKVILIEETKPTK